MNGLVFVYDSLMSTTLHLNSKTCYDMLQCLAFVDQSAAKLANSHIQQLLNVSQHLAVGFEIYGQSWNQLRAAEAYCMSISTQVQNAPYELKIICMEWEHLKRYFRTYQPL